MTKLVTQNYKVSSAKNFRSALERVDPAPDSLYLFFGRDSAWSNENSPPTPLNSISDEFVTRGNIIGVKRLTVTNTCFVAPRYDWVSGTIYAEYSATDADLFTKEFYVITSENNVYKCLDNNSGGQSIVQPSGTSTSATQTGDGYTWKFMYNLSTSIVQNFLVTDWLPVPFGGQRTSFQTSVETTAVYSTGTPVGGHGSNAVEELGAGYLMLSQSLDGDESSVFPVDDDYRQYGLWKNPRLLNGNIANATTYTVNESDSDINIETGSLLYVENRRVITRSGDQSENFQLILAF